MKNPEPWRKTMSEQKKKEPLIESKDTRTPSVESPTTKQPEPEPPAFRTVEDWRMNREWCLNQALDIVKSLKFEVKDVPAFLEKVYRKIIELAEDARRG